MHRKTTDYLDEIGFWHCARSRLLHRAAQLRDSAKVSPQQNPPARSREALDDLLHRCGLGELCRCSGHARRDGPASDLPEHPSGPQD
ncbi:hypothetical protein BLX41_14035 [Pseudomonas protegens]|uniref:hypothetical protein n=1 Tax=Pseudomonas protegens TaxID=380021 RepID=UPI000F4CEA77|nr:hypothetical protein [Pseudomonas protegens]ROL76483.1 hypothetical protein BLX41_14035 [Pseudomonas protegens]